MNHPKEITQQVLSNQINSSPFPKPFNLLVNGFRLGKKFRCSLLKELFMTAG